MLILGIETSCDETAAAIVRVEKKPGGIFNLSVLSNVVSSQIEIHKKYGGVVPEVAAREHVLNIIPVIDEALEKANLTQALSLLRRGTKGRGGIDAIAVTAGPGLITSLLCGVETAKTLAYAWEIPLVSVNHIAGHIYANFIDQKTKFNFPTIILTVSGGHTMLVLMTDYGKFKTIGETRDDAAGEAFDKAAQLLGLGYPGGPAVAAEATKFQKLSPIVPLSKGELKGVILPRPMINSGDLDFSFSGLKTALLYQIKKDPIWGKRIPEYAADFQQAVIDVLISKTLKAAKKYNAKTIMLAGGVAANKKLRQQFYESVTNKLPKVKLNIPDLKYTTDNAAMIAAAGYFQAMKKDFCDWKKLKANNNLEFK